MEPPYGVIWDELTDGNVIPFLGAGASMAGRKEQKWDPDNPTCLPSGWELSKLLAEKASFPEDDPRDLEDLAKVSSYYLVAAGREALNKQLLRVLNRPFVPGSLHEMLAGALGCRLFVSTNYDLLLEGAFLRAERPFDLIIYARDQKEFANSVLWWRYDALVQKKDPEPIDPSLLDIDLTKTTVIYKMHGSVVGLSPKWDNFVIAEEDYIEFLSRLQNVVPARLFEYSVNRHLLFLGYSLRDWNLRVVLRNLREKREDFGELQPSWAIQRNPSPLERKLWERRNVEIYDVDLEVFVERLKQQTKSKRAAS